MLGVEGEGKTDLEIDDALDGKFSPDGRWLAFGDGTSGEIYITPFPGPGGRIALSSGGGDDPRWRGDGQELFYVSHDQALISVQVQESPQGIPRTFFAHSVPSLPSEQRGIL